MKLETTFNGIKLSNPLMPASGPLVGDDEKILAIADYGVGAMVTKTISIQGAKVVRPCIVGDKNSIMNAELWSEYPADTWIQKFLPRCMQSLKVPLFISVGYTKEDMAYLIPKLDPFAAAFEVSTHYVGKDLEAIGETVREIRKYTQKPFFMKVSPHIPDPVEFARVVLRNGGNGVVAINSLGPTMKVDLKSRKVTVGNTEGEVWTSGPVIKPMALAIIRKIKLAVPECTVIGVGGIQCVEDILEFLLVGADSVQMLSAAMLKGKDLYEKLVNELPAALDKYGFKSIEDVMQSRITAHQVRYEPRFPVVDHEKCTRCGLCEKICPYFAIQKSEKIIIDIKHCFGCGLCQSKCPVHAIQGAL
ncbi:4Fe-4S binding protein [Cellulosilyticum sp. I15G10I2]|uniref:4Fe-4S binding protein n=1 Tax=Cellulosilyticum sp. I15G10I2 TaxID=1892843 RepID=UPI00085BCC08|nr:4Fe-4S binding protein [Cellulosilyticum sp. I15G10I2]